MRSQFRSIAEKSTCTRSEHRSAVTRAIAWVLSLAASVIFASAGTAEAGEPKSCADYPEVGELLEGDKRAKYAHWLECAIDELPPDFKNAILECGGAKAVKIHSLITSEVDHDKFKFRKLPAAPMNEGAGFHALFPCEMCLAVNEVELCKRIWDMANPASRRKSLIKRFFRHELIHTLQAEIWELWRAKPEQFLNDPEPTEDPLPGDSHRPSGLWSPDQWALFLWGKFSCMRALFIEVHARLIGNTQLGCDPDGSRWWLKPPFWPRKGGPPLTDSNPASRLMRGLDAAEAKKEELFEPGSLQEHIDRIKTEEGASWKKVQWLITQLDELKQGICEDLDEMRTMIEAATIKSGV